MVAMVPQATSFNFGIIKSRKLGLTLLADELRIEQGQRILEVPYDHIEEAYGYGFGEVFSVSIKLRPRERARYLNIIRLFPSQVSDFYDALSEKLGSYRAMEDTRVSSVPLHLVLLGLVSSWRKDAQHCGTKSNDT